MNIYVWDSEAVFTTLHFLPNLQNGPNKPDNYSTLHWKGLPLTNTQGYWAHSWVTKKMKCCEYNFLSRLTRVPKPCTWLNLIESSKCVSQRAGYSFKPIYSRSSLKLSTWKLQCNIYWTACFKNVKNCLNTNIDCYLETSGGQSFHLYLNVAHFFQHQC